MAGSDDKPEPGIFVSFETLLQDVSQKLDTAMRTITDELTKLNQKLDSKASKEHVDAVEKRMQAQHDALEKVVEAQGGAIVDLRVAGGESRGVSTTALIAFGIIATGIFGLLAAMVYVVAQGHGG